MTIATPAALSGSASAKTPTSERHPQTRPRSPGASTPASRAAPCNIRRSSAHTRGSAATQTPATRAETDSPSFPASRATPDPSGPAGPRADRQQHPDRGDRGQTGGSSDDRRAPARFVDRQAHGNPDCKPQCGRGMEQAGGQTSSAALKAIRRRISATSASAPRLKASCRGWK